MTSKPHLDSDLNALLEAGKSIPRLPDVVRARSLARARANAATPARSLSGGVSIPRRRGLVIALAASAALAVVGASALAAFGLRAARRGEPAPGPAPRPVPARPAPASALPPPPAVAPVPTPAPATTATAPVATPTPAPHRRPARPATAQESYAAELDLLQRAQVAYADGALVDTLALLAAHGRRFANGRLAEEREALRVRTLTRAGRAEEAQRAAAAFAERFPRSVLLSRPSKEPR
jgi:hypothetical protein